MQTQTNLVSKLWSGKRNWSANLVTRRSLIISSPNGHSTLIFFLRILHLQASLLCTSFATPSALSTIPQVNQYQWYACLNPNLSLSQFCPLFLSYEGHAKNSRLYSKDKHVCLEVTSLPKQSSTSHMIHQNQQGKQLPPSLQLIPCPVILIVRLGLGYSFLLIYQKLRTKF